VISCHLLPKSYYLAVGEGWKSGCGDGMPFKRSKVDAVASNAAVISLIHFLYKTRQDLF
jgi:hypothetical protein